MSTPLRNHPAVDLSTADAAVVVQERALVALEPLLLDALVSCPRAGVRLQLVTPPTSRLTAPLARVLQETGGQWVVRDATGRCLDGLTGRILTWDGASFTEPEVAELDPAWPSPPPTGRGSLSVELTTLHPAGRDLLLAESVETCCRVLADASPLGWGIAEPVSQPWDRRALSSLCRTRSPAPIMVVVVGGDPDRPAVGGLTVTPTDAGVREQLWLQAGADQDLGTARLDALADRLAHQVEPPRSALLGLAAGQDDGTVAAQNTGVTVPYGLLLGPSVVREVGQDRALSAPARQVRLVGPAAAPSLWVPLLPTSGPVDPGGVLSRVLRHLGVALTDA